MTVVGKDGKIRIKILILFEIIERLLGDDTVLVYR